MSCGLFLTIFMQSISTLVQGLKTVQAIHDCGVIATFSRTLWLKALVCIHENHLFEVIYRKFGIINLLYWHPCAKTSQMN